MPRRRSADSSAPSPDAPRRGPRWSVLEPRILMDANPVAAGAPPEDVQLGDDFSFDLAFQNDEIAGGQTGFGPFIDLIFPTAGKDGAPDGAGGGGDAADPSDDDGITFNSATYLGSAVESETPILFEDTNGDGTGTVDHPFAVDNTGAPVQVTGNAGDTLVVLTLPFGSYTPEQPAADIRVNASLSGDADLGEPLEIQTRAGFAFGETPGDDPATDPSVLGAFRSDDVTPTLLSLDKVYEGPEDETATGPNFQQFTSITATIAPGQTLSGFTLVDDLPTDVTLTGDRSGTSRDVNGDLPTVTTALTDPGDPESPRELRVQWAGDVSGEVTLRYGFTVLEAKFGDDVLDPATGDDAPVVDPDTDGQPGNADATATGSWSPADARDGGPVAAEASVEATAAFEAKSIAVQESVSVLGGGDVKPGAVLEYELAFQVSDFFSFDQLQLESTLSDGQRFDAGFDPTFRFSDREGLANGTYAADGSGFLGVDVSDIDNARDGSGDTVLTFDVSGAMDAAGTAAGQDAILRGGESGAAGGGAATGRVVFRAVVQDAFTDDYPTNDPSVDQNDRLTSDARIEGRVLAEAGLTPTGSTEADGSSASVNVVGADFAKTLHAVNGVLVSGGGETLVSPGDVVTYRLTYQTPSTDFEDLVFTDFLPKPVFDAATLTTFRTAAGLPAAGEVAYGPDDTYAAFAAGDAAVRDTPLIGQEGGNAFSLGFGTADDAGNNARTIDVLFSVTVDDEPFADGLKLTNLAQASEGNTQGEVQSAPAIIQIKLGEPDVVVQTGVVAVADQQPGVFSTGAAGRGGATFAKAGEASDGDPNTTADRAFSGAITSASLAADPIDSDLSGVDGGDVVRFATVLENTGLSPKGAYDVELSAVAPKGFDPASLANLTVTRGDGTELVEGTDWLRKSGAYLGGGLIELIDPTSGPRAGDGALAAGDAGDGTNLVVVTYDLTANSGQNGQNGGPVATGSGDLPADAGVATLRSFSNTEGNDNFTDGTRSDGVSVRYETVTAVATLEGTSRDDAFNGAAEAVVGELVTHRITLDIPEGRTDGIFLRQALDPQLHFVGVTAVVSDAEIGTNYGTAPVTLAYVQGLVQTTADPSIFNINLGSLNNYASSNGDVEQLVIEYQAVVTDEPGTAAGDTAQVRFQPFQQADGETLVLDPSRSDNVTVREPTVAVEKAADFDPGAGVSTSGQAGDEAVFTITLSNPTGSGSVVAHDVTLTDAFPEGWTGLSVVDVTGDVAGLSAADFEFSGRTLRLVDQSATAGFDLAPGEEAVVRVRGTLDASVTPGETLDSDATATWTSLPGPAADPSPHSSQDAERSYTDDDGAPVSVDEVVATKRIVATSEAHTGDAGGVETLVVGELVRVELEVDLPRSTLTDLRFRDLLPAGMALRGDGDVTVSFVTDATVTRSNVPATVVTETELGDGRNALLFDLGDVTVGADGTDGVPEKLIVSYVAVVENTAESAAGGGDAPTGEAFEVLVNAETAGNGNESNAVAYRYAEPRIDDLTKTAGPATFDAGDTLTLVYTFSNTGDAEAFEAGVIDTLDARLAIDPGSVTVTVDGVAAGFTNNSQSSNNRLNLTLTDALAGAAGGSPEVRVTVEATAVAGIEAGSVVTSDAFTGYSTLPGQGTDAGSNGTGLAADAGGNRQGERDGANTDPAFRLLDDAAGPTQAADNPFLTLNPPADTQVAVGDATTFTAFAYIPEGVTRSYETRFDVPDGLAVTGWRIVPGTYSGTLPAPTQTAGGGSGEDLVLAFGDLAVPVDNDSANNLFTIEVDTEVVNEVASQDGARRTLRAGHAWVNGESVPQFIRLGNGEGFDVAEPALRVTTSITGGTPEGGAATYTSAVEHAAGSSADAFDLRFTDAVPAGYAVVEVVSVAAGATGVAPAGLVAADFEVSGDGRSLGLAASQLDKLDLARGESFAVTYRVEATGAAPAGSTYANDARIAWTSTDNDPASPDPDERGGADGPEPVPAYEQGTDPAHLVVLEAERYHASTDGEANSWSVVDVDGVTAVEATPDADSGGGPGFVTDGARIDHRVNFTETGIHYVWVRVKAPVEATGNGNSINVGLDGANPGTAENIDWPNTDFRWKGGASIRLDIDTPGEHTVNTWMREDGAFVDRILLTTDASFRPATAGPLAESAGGPDGRVDTYAAAASASATVDDAIGTPTKSLVATSEAHTAADAGVEELAIGEIARVRLGVELPVGTTENVRFRDVLPAGMALRGDGDVQVSFASDATVSRSGGPATVVSATTLGDGRVELLFDLGDVSVGADGGDGQPEELVIAYAAVVENRTGVDAGGGGGEAAELLIGAQAAGGGADTTALAYRYAEPLIDDVARQVSPATAQALDAGDRLTLQTTFSNTGDTDAFEVRLLDAVELGPAAEVDPASVRVFLNGTETFAFTNATTAGLLDLTLTQALRPGDAVEARYEAETADDLAAGTFLEGNAVVTYTTLPGEGTDAAANGTGLGAAAAGETQGERTGSQTGPNDLKRRAFSATTSDGPTRTLLPPADATATVGQELDWDVEFTLPEGVTRAFRTSFEVPQGLAVTNWTLLPGTLADGFATPTGNGASASGENLELSFGDLANAPDNVADAGDRFTVRVTTVVTNEAANTDGARRVFLGDQTYTDGQGDDVFTRDATGVAVTVVEPDLSVATAIAGGATAGSTATFTTTVRHAGGSSADAFDLVFTDTAPAGLLFTGATGVAAGPAGSAPAGLTAASFEVADGGQTLRLTAAAAATIDLALGDSFTVTYEADVTADAAAGEGYQSAVDLRWTSADNDPAAPNADERGGADGVLGGMPYAQSTAGDGRVVLDATRFHGSSDGVRNHWEVFDAGAEGPAVRASANRGEGFDAGYAAESARLDYLVDFQETGTHYVWVRARAGADGDPSANDSLHVGLDGAEAATADRITGFDGSGFTWTRTTLDAGDGPARLGVATPGEHTVNLYFREDGSEVSRILLTTDASFDPTAGGDTSLTPGGPDGRLDGYAALASDDGSLPVSLALDKSASNDEPAVGEEVTFTLLASVSPGTTRGVVVADTLPAGLRFVPGSVAIAGVDAGTTFSNASAAADAEAAYDGANLSFDLGDVRAEPTGPASGDAVRVTYRAVVENLASTQETTAFNTTATATATAGGGLSDTNDAPLDVAEPTLTLASSIAGTSRAANDATALEAGDTVTYEATVAHAPGSEGGAFDLTLADTAAEGLRITSIDAVTGSSGLTAADFAVAPGGDRVELLPGRDLAAGASFTLRYTATAQSDLAAAGTLQNDARLAFTSTDGANADERDGSGTPTQNDYARSASVSASAGETFTLTKAVADASGNGGAEVGEELTYTLTLDLIEGTTENTRIADVLPAGVTLVPGSVAVTTADPNTTFSNTDAATDFTQGGPGGRELGFSLGDVVVSADGSNANETVTVTYRVTVDNVAANQRGVALGGAADAADPATATATAEADRLAASSSSAPIAVAEPDLELATVVSGTSLPGNATAGLQAGDTVTYRTTVDHAPLSDSEAFDPTLLIRAAPGTRFTSVDAVTGPNLGGIPLSDFSIYDAGDGPGSGIVLLSNQDHDLVASDGFTVTYTSTLQTDVAQAATLDATALLRWTSVDGSTTGERTGDGGALNDHRLDASASVFTGQTLGLSTGVVTPAGDGTAVIGERVTYDFRVLVPEGTTEGVTLTIDLPDAVAADLGSAVVLGGNGGVTTGFDAATSFGGGPASGNALTVSLGDVVNPDNAASGDDFVTLRFAAVVTDDATENVNGATLNATASVTTTSGAAISASDNDASFRVDEPVLELDKTINDPAPRLGDTVTFTLDANHGAGSTATAQDLVINDTLAAGLTLDAGSVRVLVDGVDTPAAVHTGNTAGDDRVRVLLDALPEGSDVRVTYDAVVTSSGGAFGSSLATTATLAYDSLPEDDGAVDGADRDSAVGSDAAVIVSGSDLNITVDDGATERTPGEAYAYTVRVENPLQSNALDARGVVVTATVPAGVTFTGATGPGQAWAAYDPATRTLSTDPGVLVPGEVATLSVPVTVDDAAASGRESLSLAVAVTQQDIEPDPADNAAADTDTLLATPDYRISVTDSASAAGLSVEPGDALRYTVVATNGGDQDGTAAVVTLQLDPRALTGVTPSGGGVYDPATGVVTWTLPAFPAEGPGGTPAAGSSVTYTVDATVRVDLAATIVSFSAEGRAADDGSDGADPTPLDAVSASPAVPVEAVPDLGVTLTDNVDGASPGDVVTYAVGVTNPAPGQEAVNAEVTVLVPADALTVLRFGTDPSASPAATPAPAPVPDPVTGVTTFNGRVVTTDGRTLAFTATLTPPAGNGGDATLVYAFDSIPVGAEFTLTHTAELNDPPPQNTRTFSSVATIADDGSNGVERNTANNTATDVNVLEVFVFDSGNDFRPAEGGGTAATFATRSDVERSGPRAFGPRAFGLLSGFGDAFQRLGPVATTADPVYSGSAAPGSSINVDLYDSLGNRVGTRTVTADAGGNWSLSLPSAAIAGSDGGSPEAYRGSGNFAYGHRLFGETTSLLGYGDGVGGNTVGAVLGDLALTAVVSGEGGGLDAGALGQPLSDAALRSFSPASGEPAAAGTRVNTPGVFAGTAAEAVAAAEAAARNPLFRDAA